MPIIMLYIIEKQHQSAKPSWREQNKANKRATKEDDMKRKKKRTLLYSRDQQLEKAPHQLPRNRTRGQKTMSRTKN